MDVIVRPAGMSTQAVLVEATEGGGQDNSPPGRAPPATPCNPPCTLAPLQNTTVPPKLLQNIGRRTFSPNNTNIRDMCKLSDPKFLTCVDCRIYSDNLKEVGPLLIKGVDDDIIIIINLTKRLLMI